MIHAPTIGKNLYGAWHTFGRVHNLRKEAGVSLSSLYFQNGKKKRRRYIIADEFSFRFNDLKNES